MFVWQLMNLWRNVSNVYKVSIIIIIIILDIITHLGNFLTTIVSKYFPGQIPQGLFQHVGREIAEMMFAICSQQRGHSSFHWRLVTNITHRHVGCFRHRIGPQNH